MTKNGWVALPQDRKWHYIQDGASLCLKYLVNIKDTTVRNSYVSCIECISARNLAMDGIVIYEYVD